MLRLCIKTSWTLFRQKSLNSRQLTSGRFRIKDVWNRKSKFSLKSNGNTTDKTEEIEGKSFLSFGKSGNLVSNVV